MKKTLKRVGIVLCVLLLLGIGAFIVLSNSAEEKLAAIVYKDIDMARVTDGTYYGETDAGLVSVKVEVAVKDHAIEGIKIIEHQNGMGSAAESIVQTMIDRNSYAVDAVSGATLSSEAIKSAVSKALSEGLGK